MPNRALGQRATVPAATTGYDRGTITPFGSSTAWPVVADERLAGRAIMLGAGEEGASVAVDADEAIRALRADIADVTEPEQLTPS